MADEYPIFDPIKNGVFGESTPLTHERRVERVCSECNTATPHDHFEAILGGYIGFGLPFVRKSTAGKLGTRSHWAFCAVCGAGTPLDAAAIAVLEKAGIAAGKPELSLETVARELASRISQLIADEQLEKLAQFGVDPYKGTHKRELLLLGLHALRVSAQQPLGEVESVALVDYTEQLVRALYTEVLKYPASTYDQALAERFAEYDEIITDSRDFSSKLESLVVHFAQGLDSADPGLILWAAQMYVGWMKANVEFLTDLNNKYELVP